MSVLPDVLAPGLRIVFCGTAVSLTSAQLGAYYARPGNKFWATLFKVGLTPRQLRPEEYATITRYGLGLTDLAKSVAGADSTLAAHHFDSRALRVKIEQYRPRILAFTSKRAAKEYLGRAVHYGLLPETIGSTRLFVLTSTSGMAGKSWSIGPREELAHCRLDLLRRWRTGMRGGAHFSTITPSSSTSRAARERLSLTNGVTARPRAVSRGAA
jgi:TDG/mug DNA glycosylase family protein